VIAVFGVYLLWLGLPRLMRAPADKTLNYVATIGACAVVMMVLVTMIVATLRYVA
jgi:hypothetical protein